jgi:hypothetical protein
MGHGLGKLSARPPVDLVGAGLVRPLAVVAMDRVCSNLIRLWSEPSLVLAGHGQGPPPMVWAGLAMGCAVYGLGCPWGSLAIDCAYHGLSWWWPWLDMDWAGHGLGWTCARMATAWADHGLCGFAVG